MIRCVSWVAAGQEDPCAPREEKRMYLPRLTRVDCSQPECSWPFSKTVNIDWWSGSSGKCLPSKPEALSSNSSTTKKKKNKPIKKQLSTYQTSVKKAVWMSVASTTCMADCLHDFDLSYRFQDTWQGHLAGKMVVMTKMGLVMSSWVPTMVLVRS
jgi:hypothetical protein